MKEIAEEQADGETQEQVERVVRAVTAELDKLPGDARKGILEMAIMELEDREFSDIEKELAGLPVHTHIGRA
jgi:actin-like ATPase involved in cell morphogenesis